MISSELHGVLVGLLSNRLPIAPDVDRVVDYVGEGERADVPLVMRAVDLARWIVDRILRQPTQQNFVRLVREIDSPVPTTGLADLVALADALDGGNLVWEPYAGVVLDWSLDSDPARLAGDLPFIDRRGFRQLLPRAGSLDTPRCILVSGERNHGKTYLSEFCKTFASARGPMRVGYVSLPDNGVNDGLPRIYAEELAVQLVVDQAFNPPEHAEPERDAENLATWISHHVPVGPYPAIAIIDHFGRPDVSKAQHRFVEELAKAIQTEPARSRLRLILLGYPASELTSKQIPFQPYVLEPIEIDHIEGWLRTAVPNRYPHVYGDTAALLEAKLRDKEQKAVIAFRALYPGREIPPSSRMKMLNTLLQIAAQDVARTAIVA